ncbi:MAG: hypothetical protein M1298_00810 [Chloroflexi bacterium]|nr:hypothetical protein [Chloroflexota bacterium]
MKSLRSISPPQLRENDQLKERPVIIISAYEGIREDLPLDGTLSLSRATGMRLEELLRVLEAILPAVDPPERYLRERSSESTMTEGTGRLLEQSRSLERK